MSLLKDKKWSKILLTVEYSHCLHKVIQENHMADAAIRGVPKKNMFLKISQHSPETTNVGVSF